MRASCWAWISPTQTGVCNQDEGVQLHDFCSVNNSWLRFNKYNFLLCLVCMCPPLLFLVIIAPSVWYCQYGAIHKFIWTEMGKKHVFKEGLRIIFSVKASVRKWLVGCCTDGAAWFLGFWPEIIWMSNVLIFGVESFSVNYNSSCHSVTSLHKHGGHVFLIMKWK